jgi:IclR family acetate operon transcriptional repressor
MALRPAPYPGAQAVARAIAVLKAFTDSRPQMTLADVSRAVKLNKATAHRLLSALEREGLVTRNAGTEAYRLGPEAIALGSRALRANNLRSVSQAELAALAEKTGETATLEVLAGSQVLILDEVTGDHLVGSAQSIGTRWPAHATSTGKVLLAHLPRSKQEAILQRALPRLTGKTLTKTNALRRELARVVQQGYAKAAEELEIGFTAVGAPVRNHEGQVVAAISLGGLSARFTPERVTEIAGLVQEAAARVSRQLGFREAGKQVHR